MRLEQIKNNFSKLTIRNIVVYFSYETPIAYNYKGLIVCRENSWGPTTGKHINYVCADKKKRISAEDFERELDIIFREKGLL